MAIFPALLFLVLAIVLLTLATFNGGRARNKTNQPPSPSKLPIIGNLHQLGGPNSLLHLSLRSLSDKHGPLMLLHMGSIPTLVVSSAEMAEEILKTHDLVFASRPWPCSNAAKQLLYGCNDLAFSPYGEYWRQVRKICVIELLSGKRVQSFTFIREEEVRNMIEDIKDSCSISAVNLTDMFLSLLSSIISRVAFGKKYTGGENGEIRFSDLAKELQVLLGSFSVGDYFPSFGWMDVLSGLDARLKRISQGMDDFLDQVIEDHLIRGNVNNDGNDDEHKDLVDVLLHLQKDANGDIHLTNDNLKAIILIMAARITCSFGGELEFENKRYSYTGGTSKQITLRLETTYEELRSRIYKIIKSRPEDCDIRMRVLNPCTNESVPPIVIEDDDDVNEFLSYQFEHPDKFIPFFIETIQHINTTTYVDSVAEEYGVEFKSNPSPLQLVVSNDQLPEPLQTLNVVTTQVSGAVDIKSNYEYKTPPLVSTADMPSSSTIPSMRVSNIPLRDLPDTSNLMTRQVLAPFDDDAFTNAKTLEYTDLLCEPTDIVKGQKFKDKSRCQYFLSQFAIRNNFQYKVIYSNSKRFTVVCFEDACKWRVHASREKGTGLFIIRTYESEHTCGMAMMKSDHRQASSKLACELVISRLAQRLGLRPADVVFAMQEKYNIRISYWKAWKARELAIEHVMGSYEDSYNQLPLYLHELRMANPGTVTAVSVNRQTWRFERCFLALGQCIRSFQKSLRRVLAIDGTHLKGKYKGVLFIATALDGDNHIFPLAFGIGESENSSSWNWFLTYLSDVVGSVEGLVIISDRHKGLMKEVPQVFPRAIHGYCAYHIYRNLVDTFKDKSLEMYYWRAVKTCRRAEFETIMHDIEMANPPVHAWLTEIGYERWASSHFPGRRFNLVTTNISECVNALFKEAREYPVTKLIEAVVLKIQELFYKRRESAASFVGPLTPWAEKQLKDIVQKARDVRCHAISRDEYYVVGDYNDTVKLNEFSCTCREFGVKGYPCMHVLSACINYNLDHYLYCSPFYTAHNYLATYSESVYPVRDSSEWDMSADMKEYCVQIKPPGQRRSAGRPKKHRIPSRGEESKTVKCGRCKQTGHNRRSCKFPIPSV